ncbi:hypothetical protein FQN60_010053, partial [Etheostoma spectabile]
MFLIRSDRLQPGDNQIYSRGNLADNEDFGRCSAVPLESTCTSLLD